MIQCIILYHSLWNLTTFLKCDSCYRHKSIFLELSLTDPRIFKTTRGILFNAHLLFIYSITQLSKYSKSNCCIPLILHRHFHKKLICRHPSILRHCSASQSCSSFLLPHDEITFWHHHSITFNNFLTSKF